MEFRMLPQPMGPRGRLPGLLIGGAERRASRGPLEGAAEVQVGEAGLRRALRVSSCGGGIQRRCLQFQPVALLFSCTNVVIMPKRKVSLTKKDSKAFKLCLQQILSLRWIARNALGSNSGFAISLLLHACFQMPVADIPPSLSPSLRPHRFLTVTFSPATRLPFFLNSC